MGALPSAARRHPGGSSGNTSTDLTENPEHRFDPAFAEVQREELDNWQRDGEPSRVLQESTEHAAGGETRRWIAKSARFDRTLEVGIGPYGVGFIAVHLADVAARIDGIHPLPRLRLDLPDRALVPTPVDGHGRMSSGSSEDVTSNPD